MSEKYNEEGDTLTLPDGRKLGYLIVGEGKPVFYFHGFPSSRLEVLHFRSISNPNHLQFIAVDRPGYGLSTFSPNMSRSDFAMDISFLADHLEIDKFSIVGYSTGGPYAITCAALLAERLVRVVVISGYSLPLDTSDMRPDIKRAHITTAIIAPSIQRKIRDMFLAMARDPESFRKSKAGQERLNNLGAADAKFWTISSESSEKRDIFRRSVVEAYRQESDSIRAHIQEVKLMKKGWEVDLSAISPELVYIWHGSSDPTIPISNAQKNAKTIPGAHLEILEDAGHMFIFENLEKFSEILRAHRK